jgi:hypothetical protein
MRAIDSEAFVREIFSYLVRIYRREGEVLAGLVEQVRTGKTAPFATLAELSELLSGRRSFGRRCPRRRVDASPAAGDLTPNQLHQEKT